MKGIQSTCGGASNSAVKDGLMSWIRLSTATRLKVLDHQGLSQTKIYNTDRGSRCAVQVPFEEAQGNGP